MYSLISNLFGVLLIAGVVVLLVGIYKSIRSKTNDHKSHYYLGGALIVVGIVGHQVTDVLHSSGL